MAVADTQLMIEPRALEMVTEVFEDFYRAEYPAMVTLALALTGDARVAEDLAQDAFIAAHRRWDEVGTYEKPGAWVRRAIINRSRSVLRRSRVELRALVRLGPPKPVVVSMPQEATEFWSAVRSLSPRQSQCLILHYLEGLPTAEIASIVGCTQATVRVHMHRGRSALAQRLGIQETQ